MTRTGLAELIAARQVTPAEVLEAAIARAEAVNPRLNAIVWPLNWGRPSLGHSDGAAVVNRPGCRDVAAGRRRCGMR